MAFHLLCCEGQVVLMICVRTKSIAFVSELWRTRSRSYFATRYLWPGEISMLCIIVICLIMNHFYCVVKITILAYAIYRYFYIHANCVIIVYRDRSWCSLCMKLLTQQLYVWWFLVSRNVAFCLECCIVILQDSLQDYGRKKGWCPYFLARYSVCISCIIAF